MLYFFSVLSALFLLGSVGKDKVVVAHKKWLYQNGLGRYFTFLILNNPVLESCCLLSILFLLCVGFVIFVTEEFSTLYLVFVVEAVRYVTSSNELL